MFTHSKGSARPGVYYPDRSFGMGSRNFRPIDSDLSGIGFDIEPISEMRELSSNGLPSCLQPSAAFGSINFLDSFCPCGEAGKGELPYAVVST